MLLLLEDVSRDRYITGSTITPWSSDVHIKLCTIGTTYIKATVSGIMVLNQKLQDASLSSMHGNNLDAMAQEGVEALLFVQSPKPTVDAPATVPYFEEP